MALESRAKHFHGARVLGYSWGRLFRPCFTSPAFRWAASPAITQGREGCWDSHRRSFEPFFHYHGRSFLLVCTISPRLHKASSTTLVR